MSFSIAAVLILVAVFFKFKTTPEVFQNLGVLALSRYSYIPTVLIYWSFVLLLADRLKVLLPLLSLVVCQFVFFTPDFSGNAFAQLRWKKRVRCLKSGKEHCAIPINPQPWVLHIHPNQKSKGFW